MNVQNVQAVQAVHTVQTLEQSAASQNQIRKRHFTTKVAHPVKYSLIVPACTVRFHPVFHAGEEHEVRKITYPNLRVSQRLIRPLAEPFRGEIVP
jgi:hypothetical protein